MGNGLLTEIDIIGVTVIGILCSANDWIAVLP